MCSVVNAMEFYLCRFHQKVLAVKSKRKQTRVDPDRRRLERYLQKVIGPSLKAIQDDMDSQQTLVATIVADAAPGASVILDLKRDVITNTTITVRGQPESRICYKVETSTAGLVGINIKLVIRENDRVLATIRRRDMLPDQLTFAGSSVVNLTKWLKWPKGSSLYVYAQSCIAVG